MKSGSDSKHLLVLLLSGKAQKCYDIETLLASPDQITHDLLGLVELAIA